MMAKFVGVTLTLAVVAVTFMLWEGKFGVQYISIGRVAYGLSLLSFALLLGWMTFKSAKRGT